MERIPLPITKLINLNSYIVETSQTEITQLDLALVVDEDVAALDVSVEEVPIVAVSQSLHYLSHYRAVQLLQAERFEDCNYISQLYYLTVVKETRPESKSPIRSCSMKSKTR